MTMTITTMINSNGSGYCTGAGRGFPCQQKPATAQAFVVHCQQTMPAADLQWGRAEKHKPQIKRSKRIAPKEEKQDELATASHGAACGGEERNPRLKPHSRIIQSSDSREILVISGDCWTLYLWVNVSNGKWEMGMARTGIENRVLEMANPSTPRSLSCHACNSVGSDRMQVYTPGRKRSIRNGLGLPRSRILES